MAIDWNYGSEAYRRIAPYLAGEFTCQRCGANYHRWHPMCVTCEGGSIRPLPLVPEEREFLFVPTDIVQVIQGRPWMPRELEEIGIEPVIQRHRFPQGADFLFRRIEDKQPAGPFSMSLGNHPGDVVLEARIEPWGEVQMVRFKLEEFKNRIRKLDLVRVTVTAMIPLNPYLASA